MHFDRDALPRLIPEGSPPESLIPETTAVAVQSLEDRELARSYLWATAIIQAGMQSNVVLPARFVHYSAGIIAMPVELLVGEAPVLSRSGERFMFGGYVLIRSTEPGQAITYLSVGGRSFPVVVVFGDVELHGRPPGPVNGSSACWVKSTNKRNGWSSGILTSRHLVAAAGMGATVQLTPTVAHTQPRSANVADIDECTIDASILGTSTWPSALRGFGIQTPAAPGMLVEFDDRNGVTQSGTVLRVFHYATYNGNLFGQRVVTDFHGQPGDSGSLLIESGHQRGVGVYMGKIPDGKGTYEGMFQDLSQAAAFFGFDTYR